MTNQMQLIAKNTGMSIGLAITFIVFVFFGGMALGSIETTLSNHEQLPVHQNLGDMFVPRTEVELQFQLMRKEMQDLKDIQKLILIEVRK